MPIRQEKISRVTPQLSIWIKVNVQGSIPVVSSSMRLIVSSSTYTTRGDTRIGITAFTRNDDLNIEKNKLKPKVCRRR